MKKHILFVCAALMLASINATAQTSPAANPQPTVQDEIRITSGQLKEAFGAVSQQLTMLNKEIGSDATLATPEQVARKEELTKSLLQIEGMLTTVNTANEEMWPEIKAKAELIRAAAVGQAEKEK